MLRRPRRRQDERGAVIVLFAMVLVVLLSFSAFAVDLGYDREVVHHLQSGTDAGALAGAQELPNAAADATKAAAARATAATYAVKGLFDGTPPALPTPSCSGYTCTYTFTSLTLTVTTPYTPAGGLSGNLQAQNLVYVQACQPGGTFFRKFIGSTGSTLCRSSVARKVTTPSGFLYGLVTLDPTGCASMQFAGDSETVLSSNGGVAVNSSCTDAQTAAMDSSGSKWSLHAGFIGVVGTATLNPCDPEVTTQCTTTVPTEGIPHFADPLALTPPAQPATARSCSFALPIEILSPGYYANSCTFGSNRIYIFRPGLYYFAQGFNSNGGVTLWCSSLDVLTLLNPCPQPSWNQDGTVAQQGGVTFFVPNGSISMNGNGTTNLPGNANYGGTTIYQSSCSGSSINGSATFVIGTIYSPCSAFSFTGSAGSPPNQVNVNGLVVANKVSISGSFDFNINVPGSAPSINLADNTGLEY